MSIVTIIKNLGYIPAVLIGLSSESYAILALFMVIDTIIGIIKAYVLYGGRSIKSQKLTLGIVKKLTVLIVPLLLAWGGRGAGIDLTLIAQSAIGVLVLSELYSILGGIYSIRTKEEIHEFDAVSLFLRKMQTFIERLLKENEDKKECYMEPEFALKEKNKTKK